MTEVVTSTAASAQLNLLAQRQQVFGVDRPSGERQSVDAGFVAADVAAAATDTSAETLPQFSAKQDDQNPVNRHTEQPAPRPDPVTGPSKARVEIKHIDLGLTPSEVVGTPDVLQRFDTNGDGRVDLAEAARAGVAREGVFTFAGLAGGQSDVEAAVTAVAEDVAAETVSPSVGAPTAAPAGSSVAVEKKLYAPADVPGAAQSRRHFVQTAAEGTASGVVDAPKKFAGQGAEVVVGRFAVDTPKVAEKADVKTTTVSEDGTGEQKIYDKVAQTETDTPSGSEQQPQQDTSARAAAQVAAYAHAAAAAAAVKAAVKALTA